MSEIDIHIGHMLRRRRRLLGLTQDQVAAGIGVRFQQVQKYECAANRISAARLWDLATFLGVPVGYFYEGFSAGTVISRRVRLAPVEQEQRRFDLVD